MKITSDNVKAGAMILGLLGIAYIGYRAYRIAGGIQSGIKENLSAVGDAVTGTAQDIAGGVTRAVRYPSEVFGNVSNWFTRDTSGENYPEPRAIREAQNAAIGAAITQRYADPQASFNTLADPENPFYNYGPAPVFGSDTVFGTMPAPYSPDSFEGLSGMTLYQDDQR